MHLTQSYPSDAPDFIRSRPAPFEWQERVQKLDRNLWVAWNPHHPDGATWCLVRHHGHQMRRGGAYLIGGLERRQDTLFGALKTGWTFIDNFFTPDGRPCGLEGSNADRILAGLEADRLQAKFSEDKEEQERRLAKWQADAAATRTDMHDDLMHEAFEETISDEKTSDTVFAKAPLKTRKKREVA